MCKLLLLLDPQSSGLQPQMQFLSWCRHWWDDVMHVCAGGCWIQTSTSRQIPCTTCWRHDCTLHNVHSPMWSVAVCLMSIFESHSSQCHRGAENAGLENAVVHISVLHFPVLRFPALYVWSSIASSFDAFWSSVYSLTSSVDPLRRRNPRMHRHIYTRWWNIHDCKLESGELSLSSQATWS